MTANRRIRIIPARAGFTRQAGMRRRSSWDHPRTRGVYADDDSVLYQGPGSSPHARGLPARSDIYAADLRIIPARAGFTDVLG